MLGRIVSRVVYEAFIAFVEAASRIEDIWGRRS
jgi:hypothetical protein